MVSVTDIRRHPERSVSDRKIAYSILDQSLLAHVAFSSRDTVFNIPMTFARMDDSIFFHSSRQGRFYKVLKSGTGVCVGITILDGIVLAKSAFNTSMNYRSVIIFGSMRDVTDYDTKTAISEALAEKMIPGRWNDCRHPTRAEINATGFLELTLEKMSVKVHNEGPIEKKNDERIPHWSGIISLETAMSAIPEDSTSELPGYIARHIAETSKHV